MTVNDIRDWSASATKADLEMAQVIIEDAKFFRVFSPDNCRKKPGPKPGSKRKPKPVTEEVYQSMEPE
jgi:hypothetical protein